jgi:dipeptidyl aminopeptidase/acylaminoacyl peptidase
VVRFQWNSKGTALYVEAIVNEMRNIWRVQVEPTTLAWQSADKLTASTGADDEGAALSRGGTRIVFTTARHVSRLWAFPIDAAAGRLTGDGTPLTPEEGGVTHSDLSPDGSRVAYVLKRPGSRRVDLWTRHIDSGERELLAHNVIAPRWSPDGKAIAYSLFRDDPEAWVLAVRALSGPERLLSQWSGRSAFLPNDWTRDGAAILGEYYSPIPGAQATLALWPASQPSSNPQRILLAEANANLYQGHFSPDGRWLSVLMARRGERGLELAVAPATGAPAAKWTRIAADHEWPDKPRWAPDGRTLYFLSRQNTSFFNLWAVRFDPQRGVPINQPFVLTHFDSPDRTISPEIANTDIGISAHRAVLTMATVTGNIWMLENVDK